MARCVFGPDIDEIPAYHASAKELKLKYIQEVQVQMCNIAHVEQPAGELALGVPTEVKAWTPVSALKESNQTEGEATGRQIGCGG